ncbi:rod shape-determining protein MreD [Thiomicrospira microaerophila]|uniref:rod shape-determining protein MreD n=1 Tax=Thiomicrospira microaerophila TaxID=406020 RepID=UPI003D809E2C|nr:rod shape-determining protein MreD [Thiomicrospira microaerophila]
MNFAYHNIAFHSVKYLVLLSYCLSLILSVYALRVDWLIILPPFALMVLLFWVVQILNQTHLFTALILGLLMDGLHQTLLGSHSLIFIIITFMMIRMRLRFRSTPLWQQSIVIGFYMLIFQILYFILYTPPLSEEGAVLYWSMPLVSIVLWPLIALSLTKLSSPTSNT